MLDGIRIPHVSHVGGDDGLLKGRRGIHSQAPAVTESPTAFVRREQLVAVRIVNHAGYCLLANGQPDGNRHLKDVTTRIHARRGITRHGERCRR